MQYYLIPLSTLKDRRIRTFKFHLIRNIDKSEKEIGDETIKVAFSQSIKSTILSLIPVLNHLHFKKHNAGKIKLLKLE